MPDDIKIWIGIMEIKMVREERLTENGFFIFTLNHFFNNNLLLSCLLYS